MMNKERLRVLLGGGLKPDTKAWKPKDLHTAINQFKAVYWKKIGLKDRLLHTLFEGVMEKFGIASFLYGYELGRLESKEGRKKKKVI